MSLLIYILGSLVFSESLDSCQNIFSISHPVFETRENSTVKYYPVFKKFIFQCLTVCESRLHAYVLIYDICVSLFDILHSVWQSLGPSIFLQWPSFIRFFGWVIFRCVYTPHLYPFICLWTFSSKEPACECWRHKRHGFDPWVGKIPWRKKWQPTSVFLPGKIPWTEEPGGLLSIASQGVRCDRSGLARMQVASISRLL